MPRENDNDDTTRRGSERREEAAERTARVREREEAAAAEPGFRRWSGSPRSPGRREDVAGRVRRVVDREQLEEIAEGLPFTDADDLVVHRRRGGTQILVPEAHRREIIKREDDAFRIGVAGDLGIDPEHVSVFRDDGQIHAELTDEGRRTLIDAEIERAKIEASEEWDVPVEHIRSRVEDGEIVLEITDEGWEAVDERTSEIDPGERRETFRAEVGAQIRDQFPEFDTDDYNVRIERVDDHYKANISYTLDAWKRIIDEDEIRAEIADEHGIDISDIVVELGQRWENRIYTPAHHLEIEPRFTKDAWERIAAEEVESARLAFAAEHGISPNAVRARLTVPDGQLHYTADDVTIEVEVDEGGPHAGHSPEFEIFVPDIARFDPGARVIDLHSEPDHGISNPYITDAPRTDQTARVDAQAGVGDTVFDPGRTSVPTDIQRLDSVRIQQPEINTMEKIRSIDATQMERFDPGRMTTATVAIDDAVERARASDGLDTRVDPGAQVETIDRESAIEDLGVDPGRSLPVSPPIGDLAVERDDEGRPVIPGRPGRIDRDGPALIDRATDRLVDTTSDVATGVGVTARELALVGASGAPVPFARGADPDRTVQRLDRFIDEQATVAPERVGPAVQEMAARGLGRIADVARIPGTPFGPGPGPIDIDRERVEEGVRGIELADVHERWMDRWEDAMEHSLDLRGVGVLGMGYGDGDLRDTHAESFVRGIGIGTSPAAWAEGAARVGDYAVDLAARPDEAIPGTVAIGVDVAGDAARGAARDPALAAGVMLPGLVVGAGAARGIDALPELARAHRVRRRTDERVPFEALESATRADRIRRGEEGRWDLPFFETDTGAPTRIAVREIERRARDVDPAALPDGWEAALYHTTMDRFPDELTVTRGRSELDGLWTSPDPSPLRLREGAMSGASLSSAKPRLPNPFRAFGDEIVMLPGDRITGMPGWATGSAHAVRMPDGEIIGGLGRWRARSIVDGTPGAEMIPDPTTTGSRFLRTEADPGTAYVRPTGGRSPELEAIFPPDSRFRRIDEVAVDMPGGRTIPMKRYARVDEDGRPMTRGIRDEDLTGPIVRRDELPRDAISPVDAVTSRAQRRLDVSLTGAPAGATASLGLAPTEVPTTIATESPTATTTPTQSGVTGVTTTVTGTGPATAPGPIIGTGAPTVSDDFGITTPGLVPETTAPSASPSRSLPISTGTGSSTYHGASFPSAPGPGAGPAVTGPVRKEEDDGPSRDRDPAAKRRPAPERDKDPLSIGWVGETVAGFAGLGVLGSDPLRADPTDLEAQIAAGAEFGELMPALDPDQEERFGGTLNLLGSRE